MNSTPVVPRITALHQWMAVLFVCGLLGCGRAPADPNRAVVSGAVSFEGQPLKGGSISFQNATAEGTTARIRSDGTYTTDRVPLGKNAVALETESLKYGNPSAFIAIPAKYNDIQTSGFLIEIKPGDNSGVNFEMKR